MHRSVVRLYLTLVAGLALAGAVAGGVAAQDAAHGPHPSHVHPGTCATLDPQPAYPLNDVTFVSPDAAEGTVEVAHTTIDATLDELLAAPHAINVHESAENAATYISCGDIAGPVVDGLLLISMREQSDSGYYGIAALASNDAGGTDVSVYIAPEPGAAPVATPVADAAAAGGAEAAAEETEVAAPQEAAVEIVDFTFTPQVLEIPVGTTVTWTNNDTTQHTATSTAGAWDSGILAQGDTFSFTFTEAGTFDYICSLHPNMTGQIVVTG